MPKSEPYYPNKKLSYGSIYFFIRAKVFSINPFDKDAVLEGKRLILLEAREASPSYKLFIKAAVLATGLSERTIQKIIYEKDG